MRYTYTLCLAFLLNTALAAEAPPNEICWQNPTENVDGTPVTELNLIRIHYDTVSHTTTGGYATIVDYPLTGSQRNPGERMCYQLALQPGTYYVRLTAVDPDGDESALSVDEKTLTILAGGAPVDMQMDCAANECYQRTVIIGETGTPINITWAGSDGPYTIEVFEFPADDAMGNLALNKTATSSSNQLTNLSPDLAVDGVGNTRWASTFTDPSWIAVDLGASYTINRVNLSWETAYGSAYEIQVSADANNWVTAYSTNAGDGGADDVSFAPISARHVRMYGTQRGTQWGYSLYEFEVYGVTSVPMIRAQTPNNSFEWTPTQAGAFEVRVTGQTSASAPVYIFYIQLAAPTGGGIG